MLADAERGTGSPVGPPISKHISIKEPQQGGRPGHLTRIQGAFPRSTSKHGSASSAERRNNACGLPSPHCPSLLPPSPPTVRMLQRKRERKKWRRKVQLYLSGEAPGRFRSDVAAPQPPTITSYDQEAPAPAACHMTRLQRCRGFWDLEFRR